MLPALGDQHEILDSAVPHPRDVDAKTRHAARPGLAAGPSHSISANKHAAAAWGAAAAPHLPPELLGASQLEEGCEAKSGAEITMHEDLWRHDDLLERRVLAFFVLSRAVGDPG